MAMRALRFARLAAVTVRASTSALAAARPVTRVAPHSRHWVPARHLATTTAHTPGANDRVVLAADGELITCGPGYVQYSGPAPESDAHLIPGAAGVMTFARLRDACPCPACIHPSTRQKTHTSAEAATMASEAGTGVLPEAAMHIAEEEGEKGICVHWPTPEGKHTSFYSLPLLRRLNAGRTRGQSYIENELKRRLWTCESLVKETPESLWTDYADLHAGAAGEKINPSPLVLHHVLEQLQRYGIAVIRDVPTAKTGNEDCDLRDLAESIGLLRTTFYGETWDVKNVPNARNVAYTNLNLGLHMDLLYMALPPRFQLLHCLRNRVYGGASYFVDSFAAAHAFNQKHPDLYAVLQRNPLEYEYDNDGHYLAYRHPIVPRRNVDSTLIHTAVNWSPPFQAAPTRVAAHVGHLDAPPIDDVAGRVQAESELYAAIQAFQAEIDDPKYRFEFTMREGDVVLFDNQRVLHARTAFRDKTPEEAQRDGTVVVQGEPTRWLKGCYLDGSTVWDKLATLQDYYQEAIHGVRKNI
ncbi:hypothetical protein CcaverHIS002_0211440 [Cutaneotrichosporon cavernicola]|uniref:Clavaminate synthase-like protein n=1 Tax=Cutaneotrichosporon cavernicola TaxID=279322 RepID=A0AA48L1Z2_9TREE|nr:uncharacterized protein CcaverHIS019_0211440 [Cutaneotrichosporon cavernicola]BEI81984.1 hypothetical protein CcaverHIS002_0211440 [Cutaneotrichosporon cavernicola]BEI89782.1 hypothetical protein CcaverHIS019_0211440 [Cutaneotrichosporon cavernicola]